MMPLHREPTLDEMLSDPLIEILMRADGVHPEKLRPALHAVARGLARAPLTQRREACCAG